MSGSTKHLRTGLRGLSLMTMHNPPHPGEFIRETYIEPFDSQVRKIPFEAITGCSP